MMMLVLLMLFIICFTKAFDDPLTAQSQSQSRALADLGNGMHIYNCDRGMFLLSDYDNIISKSLKQWGSYDDPSLALILAIIQPGDIVIDIGANIGAFTIPFATRVGSLGKVYCIEAIGTNFHRLLGNIAINRLSSNVRPIHAILDMHEKDGTTVELPIITELHNNNQTNMGGFSIPDTIIEFETLRASASGGSGSSINDRTKVLSERVQTRSLDSLFLQFEDKDKDDEYDDEDIEQKDGEMHTHRNSTCPSVIKIDVEGMELAVLQGGLHLLQRCRPIIHAENNCIMTSLPVIEFLDTILYYCYWDVNELPLHVSINIICLPIERVVVKHVPPVVEPVSTQGVKGENGDGNELNPQHNTDTSTTTTTTTSTTTSRNKILTIGFTRVLKEKPYLTQYDKYAQLGYTQVGNMTSCAGNTFELQGQGQRQGQGQGQGG